PLLKVSLDLTDAAETMLKEMPVESLESIDEEVLKSHVLGVSSREYVPIICCHLVDAMFLQKKMIGTGLQGPSPSNISLLEKLGFHETLNTHALPVSSSPPFQTTKVVRMENKEDLIKKQQIIDARARNIKGIILTADTGKTLEVFKKMSHQLIPTLWTMESSKKNNLSGDLKFSILENNVSDFERVLSINVTGVFLGTKHAARVMIPARGGSIISIGSIASTVGGNTSHAYTSSKHAVAGLIKNVAAELGEFGIRVNCVSPHFLLTPATMPIVKKYPDLYTNVYSNLKGIELKEQDVAEATLFLASDESKYISGHNLAIDGDICYRLFGIQSSLFDGRMQDDVPNKGADSKESASADNLKSSASKREEGEEGEL
ncbi:secoisolariciresinol dehydrogenase-like protein, partial [Tanacetum coccineum]